MIPQVYSREPDQNRQDEDERPPEPSAQLGRDIAPDHDCSLRVPAWNPIATGFERRIQGGVNLMRTWGSKQALEKSICIRGREE
jgi:hypothetical protein